MTPNPTGRPSPEDRAPQLGADDEHRKGPAQPREGQQSSWRPWTAGDIAYYLEAKGWPGATFHNAEVGAGDEATWRRILETADAAALAGICKAFKLGGQALDDEDDGA